MINASEQICTESLLNLQCRFNQVDLCFVQLPSWSTSLALSHGHYVLITVDRETLQSRAEILLISTVSASIHSSSAASPFTSSLARLSPCPFFLREHAELGCNSSEHFIMPWRQWAPLSAALTPVDLCYHRPSDPVYC